MDRTIRKATPDDIDDIMALMAEGRAKMVAEGNIHQWADGHPARQLVDGDVAAGVSYVVADDGRTVATFALVPGPDPTYACIYDGAWPNEAPYHVIHRVASASGVHGVMRSVLQFAFTQTATIRIDTHADNRTMRRMMQKMGFDYCGVIHLANGDPRLAFQKTKTE